MMDTYRDEQTDRFINNEMEPEERKAFCRELETNEELQKQVKLRGLLAEAEIREAERQAFRTLTANPRKQYKKLVRSSIAAAAIVSGILFFIGSSYRYTPAEIFPEHYEQPVIEPSRGVNEIPAILHIANTHLLHNQAQEAIALLTPEVLHSEYGEEAEWILLCAYLQANERTKARNAARNIRQQGGIYAEKAADILKALDERNWF